MTPGSAELLERAFDFANQNHRLQTRKGSHVPYVSHLLQVSGMVLESGGTIDQGAAALLHDVVEDCNVELQEIQSLFGSHIAEMVRDCSDYILSEGPKPPWKARKLKYIEHLDHCLPESLLITACDKLHNLRATVRDVRARGAIAWEKFSAEPTQLFWYYDSVIEALANNRQRILSKEIRINLKAILEELCKELQFLKRTLLNSQDRSKPAPSRSRRKTKIGKKTR